MREFGWTDRDLLEKGERLKQRADLDAKIGELAVQVATREGSYDAGFEAGVLASEQGLGRAAYDG